MLRRGGVQHARFFRRAADFLVGVGCLLRKRSPSTNTSSSLSTVDCAQIAADALGLVLDRVEFRVSTSDLPDAGIAGGSAHTATAGLAVHNAGAAVIAKLANLGTRDDRSPLFGAGNAGVMARDGRLFRRDDETRGESYADILARASLAEIDASGACARARGVRGQQHSTRDAWCAWGSRRSCRQERTVTRV